VPVMLIIATAESIWLFACNRARERQPAALLN
jgi:hypothetical protein